MAFEAGDGAWLDAADAVVPRGRSSELLSLLRAAEHRGIPTLNTAAGIAATQNKARLAFRLEAGGVPVAHPRERGPFPVGLADIDGPLTLFAAGRRVWATGRRLRVPLELGRTDDGTGRSSDRLRELSLRCGRLLGLELFGVECVPSEKGHQVVDVADFPGFEGVPDASAALADQVLTSLRLRR